MYLKRDIDQREIDLLYVDEDAIYPIEVKKGEAPNKPTKNFNVLSKYHMEIKPGLVVVVAIKCVQLTKKPILSPFIC